jgi:uncharacterized repeat protein (TIGR03803 family)
MKKSILLTLIIISFSITTKGQFSKLFDFSGITTGAYPNGSLIYDGTYLYGMTATGGVNDDGVIFKIKKDGTGYSKILDLDSASSGMLPFGSLYYDGSFLYGMTSGGGANKDGTIIKIKPDGTGYSKLFDFSSFATGSFPIFSSLISDGTFLYGMTAIGGATGRGVIFKIKPDGTAHSILFDFPLLLNGKEPYGSLFSDGTFLYGMTRLGGAYDEGVIFKIKPDGTGFSKLLDFDVSNGRHPYGSLIYDGTFLYGMAEVGGINSDGVVFKIKTDGTAYSIILHLDGNITGQFPFGDLLYDGSFLYGMASNGGPSAGAIFKVKPDGTGFLKLHSFSGTDGNKPNGSLVSDGIFLYGMAQLGGINNLGVIFKSDIVTAIPENGLTSALNVFPNPTSDYLTIKLPAMFSEAEISIYDQLGQLIVHSTFVKGQSGIDITNLSTGVYTLEVASGRDISRQKFVKE